jgi:hypothetical protein
MKFASMRSAVVIASVIVGSVIPSQAFAQTPIDVFSGGIRTSMDFPTTTVYTFSSSMILNSIGFVIPDAGPTGAFQFSISTIDGGAFVNPSTSSLGTFNAADSAGVRWFDLSSPITLSEDDTVTVKTTGSTGRYYDQTLNAAANVSFVTEYTIGSVTTVIPANEVSSNSNLRVSNPSSNVAPEPGSFALALTGGAALIGVCIRRRRNAA